MNGTYTIGLASPNYQTIQAAVDSLITNGINGDVTFNIQPGTYNEQLTIPNISGSSNVNSILFQSSTGDSSDVVVEYNPSSDSDNFTIKFDGASYITVKKITITSLGTNFSRCIEISNGSSNISFLNNELIGQVVTSPNWPSWSNQVIVYSPGNQGNNIVFDKNLFYYGFGGIYFNNDLGSYLKSGTLITNNYFNDQYSYPINLKEQTSPYIYNNIINSITISYDFTGILLYHCYNFSIMKNKIAAPNSYGGSGISMVASVGTAVSPSLIANNFIHINVITGYNSAEGIADWFGDYNNVYYNSIHLTGNETNSNVIQCYNNSLIKNNILTNHAFGTVYSSLMANTETDFNAVFTNGTNIGMYNGPHPTLADWQTATGNDYNSIFVEPSFVTNSDLHTNTIALNGSALPISSIYLDIDNDIRNMTHPDIGADEFNLSDIQIINIGKCFALYPNPNDGEFILEFENPYNHLYEIEIKEITGKIIYNTYLTGSKKNIILNEYSKGIYFITLTGTDNSMIQKLILK